MGDAAQQPVAERWTGLLTDGALSRAQLIFDHHPNINSPLNNSPALLHLAGLVRSSTTVSVRKAVHFWPWIRSSQCVPIDPGLVDGAPSPSPSLVWRSLFVPGLDGVVTSPSFPPAVFLCGSLLALDWPEVHLSFLGYSFLGYSLALDWLRGGLHLLSPSVFFPLHTGPIGP